MENNFTRLKWEIISWFRDLLILTQGFYLEDWGANVFFPFGL